LALVEVQRQMVQTPQDLAKPQLAAAQEVVVRLDKMVFQVVAVVALEDKMLQLLQVEQQLQDKVMLEEIAQEQQTSEQAAVAALVQ
jgi:hypothetical protein